ncbi:MAG: DNA/RNA non-specific endonuclease [Bacteroidaceae bacterium]|nr:DNA/RNA non-specific endonuclease [Bacteroidaceae bacterium]
MAKRKKKKQPATNKILWVAAIVAAGILISYFIEPRQAEGSADYSSDLAVPVFTATPSKSQIIEHTGYTVSYNSSTKNPNWVGYELTAEEAAGVVGREAGFCCDPMVRGTQACDDDYKNSGWDRGHMAPAADMKWSKQAMEESFYLSNVSPQNKNLNRGVWKKLEELTRDKAELYGRVVVVTGPIFNGNKQESIGYGHVKIPDAFFKVLLTDYNGKYRSIGFVCKNKAEKKKLKEYAMSIDEVEELTGLDFFTALPDETENEMEKSYSAPFWGLY